MGAFEEAARERADPKWFQRTKTKRDERSQRREKQEYSIIHYENMTARLHAALANASDLRLACVENGEDVKLLAAKVLAETTGMHGDKDVFHKLAKEHFKKL